MARGRKDYEKAVIAVESEGFQNPHGRILMYDSFEDTPMKWLKDGSGTHSETRQEAAAYNGSFGMRLDVTALTPGIEDRSAAYRYVPIDVTRRLLLELFWRINDLSRLKRFHIRMRFYDGDIWHIAIIEYNQGTEAWYYQQAAGGLVAIPGGNQSFFNNAWNELTISVDFSTDEYLVFKSNNLEINMGGITCQNIGFPFGAHAEVWIVAYSDTGDRLLFDVDEVIMRELER